MGDPCRTKGILPAQRRTGTGKTAGFTLPLLHRLSDKSVKGQISGRPQSGRWSPTPTRELAAGVGSKRALEYGEV